MSQNRPSYTLSELASELDVELRGNGDVAINDVAAIEDARSGDISFVANKVYLKYIESTSASALILATSAPEAAIPTLRHTNPYLKFAQVIDLLYPDLPLIETGIHKAAVVEDGAAVDSSAGVGAFCHIRSGSSIGRNSQLISSVFVGKNVTIEDNCLIYPGVKIMDDCRIGSNVIIHSSTVIGSDGFGFAPTDSGLKKIKQIGHVVVEDQVEIGSNVSIDRGSLGPTRIGRGTKIDNLVQIAHNVETGENCIIVALVGISGSTKLGNGVVLGGQVGSVGHITIGDNAQVAAQSGIKDNLEANKKYFGTPAREFMDAARIEAALNKLPELLKRVRKLEKE